MQRGMRDPSISREEDLHEPDDLNGIDEDEAPRHDKPSKHRSVPSDLSTKELFDEYSDPLDSSLTDDQVKKDLLASIKVWGELLSNAGNGNESNKHEFEKKRDTYSMIFSNAYERNIFQNDPTFAHQVFFGYLNILDTPDIRRFLTAKSWSTVADAIIERHIYIMDHCLTLITDLVPFHDNDLPERYDPLINAMRINIEQTVRTVRPASSSSTNSVHQKLLDFIWNLSDRTLVVPSLLRNGVAKSIVESFVLPTLVARERRAMTSIIHNLSRHDLGADELNNQNTIEILKGWQGKEGDEDWEVSFLKVMAVAHLSTPDQIKNDPSGTESILDQLLQVTINAKVDQRKRYLGFHISEPLSVLAKIFVNDSSIDYVLNQAKTKPPSNAVSTIHLFSDLLVEFLPSLTKDNRLEQFTFIALCNIIWSISFHERYHSILKQNVQLIDIIKRLAQATDLHLVEQYVPRTMLNIKKATDGILFNLNLEDSTIAGFQAEILDALTDVTSCEIEAALPKPWSKPRRPLIPSKPARAPVVSPGPMGPAAPPQTESLMIPPVPPPQSTSGKPLVMISYCHANNEFCDKILELLDQKTDLLEVWIDRRCCKSSGDVWESIARGIKGAQLIICIVSTEYLASKACRQEVIYAKDRLNKPFLPVYVEKPVLTEWLDIRLAEFKYVRFQNTAPKLDERKVQEFLSTLMESVLPGHEKSNDVPVVHHSQPIATLMQSSDSTPTPKVSEPKILAQSRPEFPTDNLPVSQWTSAEIHRWFAEHQISSEIRDLYDFKNGTQMIAYGECFSDGWQRQYDRYAPRYAERFKGKELSEHEFALFASALKDLYNNHYVKKVTATNPKPNGTVQSTNPQQACWCVLL